MGTLNPNIKSIVLGVVTMLFKFLTGKEISNLQTGLIFSQAAGLVWIFIALMLMFPSDSITVNEGGPPALILLIVVLVRMLLPNSYRPRNQNTVLANSSIELIGVC